MTEYSFKDFLIYLNSNKKQLKEQLIHEKPLKIFRIEKNGIGPYRQSQIIPGEPDLLNSETENYNPAPENDFREMFLFINQNYDIENFFFGFTSLKQMKEWFSEEDLSLLFKNGYEVNEYESKIYYRSESQVMFYKEDSL